MFLIDIGKKSLLDETTKKQPVDVVLCWSDSMCGTYCQNLEKSPKSKLAVLLTQLLSIKKT